MEYSEMLMPTIWAVIYTLGAYLYYWHVKTIIHFAGEENLEYSEFRMLRNSAFWPLQVIEIMIYHATYREEDEE
jgi:uncharacterized protein (DUF2062 family)